MKVSSGFEQFAFDSAAEAVSLARFFSRRGARIQVRQIGDAFRVCETVSREGRLIGTWQAGAPV